jgi:hypothetical protein
MDVVVELLGNRDEADAVFIEGFDDPDEVR